MIEQAYRLAESLGLNLWTEDEAGPFQTIPYPGQTWQPEGKPKRQPHEYVRNGTAKLLTLFHPSDGQVRVKGVTSCPNVILHPWLKQELSTILDGLPPPTDVLDPEANRALWERWCVGLAQPVSLPDELPPLRILLVWDNLTGHKTSSFVDWLIQHGIMPLYTPLGGSWLNMTESIQRILKRRALARTAPNQTRRDHRLVGSGRQPFKTMRRSVQSRDGPDHSVRTAATHQRVSAEGTDPVHSPFLLGPGRGIEYNAGG